MQSSDLPTLNAPWSVILSIHDVMPHTLEPVGELLETIAKRGLSKITLLVVPGLDWSESQLKILRRWQDDGHILAGHGWLHRTEQRRTPYHKLHGILLSRMVAEHLSLSEDEIADLIERNHRWFVDQGFEEPQIYVPPAWGMGPIPRARLRTLPFRFYEHLNGVYDARFDIFHKIPVTGFEVDTWCREFSVRALHRFLLSRRKRPGMSPLRISIHPQDHRLRMAQDLVSTLELPLVTMHYHDLTALNKPSRIE